MWHQPLRPLRRPEPGTRAVACGLAILSLAAPITAQDDDESISWVLLQWAAAFDEGKIDLHGKITADQAGSLYEGECADGSMRTHYSALQRLLRSAEQGRTVPLARGVLAIAAVGNKRSLYDLQVQQVRESGFWTLQRMADADVWSMLQRVAAGEPFARMPWFPNHASAKKPAPTLRAAALRALGIKNDPGFRKGVEKALTSTDTTLRLAAAEAIGHMRRVESVPMILDALATEKHSVVTHALLLAVQRLLGSKGSARLLTAAQHERALQACIRLLGRSHWRTEMTVVEILAEHPQPASIPALIGLLKPRRSSGLRDAVNASASPVLRHSAWQALRKLTGAVIPQDAEAWTAFWKQEQGRIKLVQPRDTAVPNGTSSAGPKFYGIPVIGRSEGPNQHRVHRQGRGCRRFPEGSRHAERRRVRKGLRTFREAVLATRGR